MVVMTSSSPCWLANSQEGCSLVEGVLLADCSASFRDVQV